MKAPSYLLVILVVAFQVGCGKPLLIVHSGPTPSAPTTGDESLPGIPFYVKTAGCKQQTVWLQPIYTLTLKTIKTTQPTENQPEQPSGKQGEKPKENPAVQPVVETRTDVAVLTVSAFRNTAVASLRGLLSGPDKPSPEDVAGAWANVQALTIPDPFSVDENQLSGRDSGKVIRVANQVMVENYVDYKTTYYYNVEKPLSGTSQASFKLGGDGTMTEGSAQIQSTTLQTFLSLLPVSDVLSKVASAGLGTFNVIQQPRPTYKFELTTDTRIFKHTHEAWLKDPEKETAYLLPPCPEEPGEVKPPYNLTIEDVTDTKKDSGDGSTVRVTGSIVLPKPEEKKN